MCTCPSNWGTQFNNPLIAITSAGSALILLRSAVCWQQLNNWSEFEPTWLPNSNREAQTWEAERLIAGKQVEKRRWKKINNSAQHTFLWSKPPLKSVKEGLHAYCFKKEHNTYTWFFYYHENFLSQPRILCRNIIKSWKRCWSRVEHENKMFKSRWTSLLAFEWVLLYFIAFKWELWYCMTHLFGRSEDCYLVIIGSHNLARYFLINGFKLMFKLLLQALVKLFRFNDAIMVCVHNGPFLEWNMFRTRLQHSKWQNWVRELSY